MAEEVKAQRTNGKVKTEYRDANGEKCVLGEDVRSVAYTVPDQGIEGVIKLEDLNPGMFFAAAAFGLNTRLRNEVNTAADTEAGAISLNAFVKGFLEDGVWKSASTAGGGTPLVIEAMIEATKAAGKWTQEKEDSWLAEYHGLSGKDKAKWTAARMAKPIIAKTAADIKLRKAKEAASKLKGSKPSAEDLEDL